MPAEFTPMRRPPPNPVRYLCRFFAQPRLRLAWALAAARSSWWSMFYVYAPIRGHVWPRCRSWRNHCVDRHWLDVGRRFGRRHLLQAGYGVAGGLSLCAALTFGMPWLGATLLVLAALGTEIIDGAGNLLFLRAVHVHERSEMTTVFVSFRDVAQLGPPAVCSVLLSLFSLPSVFVAGGLMMLASSWLCRRIPRRL